MYFAPTALLGFGVFKFINISQRYYSPTGNNCNIHAFNYYLQGANGEMFVEFNGKQWAKDTLTHTGNRVYYYAKAYNLPGTNFRFKLNESDSSKFDYYDWFIQDHNGATKLVINSNTNVFDPAKKYMNYPYGDTLKTAMVGIFDSDLNAFGSIQNHEMPYSIMGFRIYSEELGRFLSPDPLFEKFDSWTPYHFSFNNPVMYSDPSGLAPKKEKREARLLTTPLLAALDEYRRNMQNEIHNEYRALLEDDFFPAGYDDLSWARYLKRKRGNFGAGFDGITGGSSGGPMSGLYGSVGADNKFTFYANRTISTQGLTFPSESDMQRWAGSQGVEANFTYYPSTGHYSVHSVRTTAQSPLNNPTLSYAFENYFSMGYQLMISTDLSMSTSKYKYSDDGQLASHSSSDGKSSKYGMPTIFIYEGDIGVTSYKGVDDIDYMFNNYAQIFWHEFGHAYYMKMMNENISTFSIDFLGLNRMTFSNKISVSFENHYNQIKGFYIRSLHNYDENGFYLSPGYGYKPNRFNDLIRKYSK